MLDLFIVQLSWTRKMGMLGAREENTWCSSYIVLLYISANILVAVVAAVAGGWLRSSPPR